jgi:hypothetical protein
MICKICSEDKQKEPILKGEVTRFIDESGKVWNGKMCPSCYKIYNRERMRKSRKIKLDSQNSDIQET